MGREERSTFLKKVYDAADTCDLQEAYDAWAGKYDADVTAFGYKIPAVAAGFFGKYVASETTPILDAGAGTGMMGDILDALGYRGQVGIDLSACMLKMAGARNVYGELYQMVLGEKLDFPSDHFGACQSIGVFTAGHAPADAFDELVRVLRTGGYIIFSILEDVFVKKGYKDKFESLEKSGKWRLVERTKPFQGMPLECPDQLNRVYVYQVC
jgi:predicted TPR repeat methyltransferase